MSEPAKKDEYNVPGTKTKATVSAEGSKNYRNNDTNLTLEEAQDIWDMLKAHPKYVNCPYCSHKGITWVERKANVLNLVFCICCPSFWSLYMLWFKKTTVCWDADHKCMSCDKMIYDYKAC